MATARTPPESQARSRAGAWALAALALGLVLLAAGCSAGTGADQRADLGNGKRLFTGEGRCGSCHVLARAGTKSSVGPSLDAAFAQARADGLGERTIEGVVYEQMKNPRNSSVMPADLVTGQDARDVAAYVASAAGRPGEDPAAARELAGQDPTATRGRALFLGKGCGGCHILSDAKTGASVGPQLNDMRNAAKLKGDSLRGYVRGAILDPDADIVAGFDRGLMPSDYGERLSEEEVETLVDYLLQVSR